MTELEEKILQGLTKGEITATEDIDNYVGKGKYSYEEIEQALDQLEKEGKIELTPVSYCDVPQCIQIELLID